MEEAFRRLQRPHQQLLLWAKVDELTYEEMTARLGISHEMLIRKMANMIMAWCQAVEDVEAGLAPSFRGAVVGYRRRPVSET